MYLNHMSQHGEQLGGGPIVHAQTVPPRESCDELSERLYKVSVWTFNKQHDFNCESKCPHDLLRNQVCKEANGYHSKYAAYQNNSWMPAGLTSFYGTSSDEVLRELYDQKRRVTRSLACSNNAYKTKTECVQLSQSVLPHIQPGAYQGAICNQSIIPNKQDSMTGSKLFSFLPYEVGTHASAIRNNSCGHIPFGFEANIHNIVDQMCSENVWKPTGAEAKSLAHNMQPKHGGLASFENYNRNLALSTTLCFEQKISDSDSLIKRQRTSSISTIQAGNSMRFKSKGMNDHPELQARGPRNLERNDLNADTAENWRSSSLKNKEVKMCFQRPCTGPENPVTKYRNPQEAGISKYSAACDYERRRLLALVEYYKFSMNNGFGLIPIINTFTAKHKYVSGNKKRDFCPPIPDSCENTVLYEVEFVKTERWALFQGVDVLAETGESLHHCLDQQIILEMDGGIDLATLRSVEYMPLTPGLQEIAFMPALRRPNQIDMELYQSKQHDERHLLTYCRDLLSFPEYTHYKMNVVNAELQIDRKKLIVFAEFVHKIQFNDYVKTLYEYCKNYFRGTKPRIFIQNKFVPSTEFVANAK